MTAYRYGTVVADPSQPQFQAFLAAAYEARGRPSCLCSPGGVPMYVARAHGRLVIKRMPSSGAEHQTHCDSYDALQLPWDCVVLSCLRRLIYLIGNYERQRKASACF